MGSTIRRSVPALVATAALGALLAAFALASASAATRQATVSARGTTLGTVLTGAGGRTLYLWKGDRGGRSACSGACAKAWPPLMTSGKPKAAGAVKASLLGTVSRASGKQVTYKGQPLYYYAGDSKAGQANGQASNGFGARWWVVATSGKAITKTADGTSTPTTTGQTPTPDTGGYGY